MPIAFKRYIDISSVVGGNPAVPARELILRMFSPNPLIPTETVLEFTSSQDVGAYFGLASEEFARAQFYFDKWISKQLTRPRKLSFWFWSGLATAPLIYGKSGVPVLATLQAIGAGSFTMTIGNNTNVVAVNFGADGSFNAVAATLQAAIRAAGAGDGAVWTNATVTYDATNARFDFVGGAQGAKVIGPLVDGAETPLAALGWLTGAILSNGIAAETLTQTLTNSASTSNNFGSFLFLGGDAFTLQQAEEIATWNAAQDVSYIDCQAVTVANAAAWSAGVFTDEGAALILDGPAGEYHEMMPAMILAATDYTRRNAAQNYMYQQFPLTPTVVDDADVDTYDGLRVNYYGATQESGVLVAFLQRGVLMGDSKSPTDMGVYANEMWFKSAVGVRLMNYFLTVSQVPVNNAGRAALIAQIMTVVDNNTQGSLGAVQNGTISANKTLTPDQIADITQDSDDPNAWRQVQTIGYWLDVEFESFKGEGGDTEWKAIYTLIYSKDDVVRKVEGTHVLI